MKKKNSLQKRKEDINSKLWRNKADKYWRLIVLAKAENKCAVCGSDKFLQMHHLIPREFYSHRHEIDNGICLCAAHHKYSLEISPHRAPAAFFEWMISYRPEIWTWLIIQTPTRKNEISFKDIVAKLEKLVPAKNKKEK